MMIQSVFVPMFKGYEGQTAIISLEFFYVLNGRSADGSQDGKQLLTLIDTNTTSRATGALLCA